MTTTARIRLALEGQGQVVQGIGQVQNSMASLGRSMASLAGGLSVGATVGQLVKVQREFDVLNSSLVTVTGSSAAAEREMQWIKAFAATTPYGLNEVTGAFVKMKALGLDPSQKALTSYGNTASAMGKDLNQMIEAVADAATGEFERLKEFGIKARKQGDDVALTFRGVTTKIGNNAAEITAYLQQLGNNDFAGAMSRRAATLDGAISNLGDSWDELFRTVNEAGVGDLMATSVRGAAEAMGGLSAMIRENRTEIEVLTGAIAGGALLATLPRLAAGLTAVAVSVRAIGLAMAAHPLALVLLGVGSVVGGMAAYNSAYRKTADGMRKTIDQMEEANRMATENLTGRNLRPEIVRDVNKAIAERTQKINELKAALTSLDAPVGSVGSGDTALRRAQAEAAVGGSGGGGGGAGKPAATRAQTAAEKELAEQQKRSAEIVSLRNKLVEQGFEAQQRLTAAAREGAAAQLEQYTNAATSAEQRLEDLQQEADAIAYADANQVSLSQAVEITTIARLKEQQVAAMGNEAIVMALQSEIDAREKIIAQLGSREVRDAAKKLREDEAKAWETANQQIAQSLTDAIMSGGRSIKDYLVGLFRTIVLRPILAPIGAGLVSMLMPGSASAGSLGGGGGFGLDSISNLLNPSRIFSGFGDSLAFAADSAGQWLVNNTSGFLNQTGSALMGNAGNIGTAGSYLGGAAAGIGIGRSISGGYSAIGRTGNTAVNAGTIIGSIFGGPIGGAIGGAIGGLVNRVFGRKLADSGISGDFGGPEGFTGQSWEFFKGGFLRSDKTTTSPIDETLRQTLASRFTALTASNAAAASALGFDTSRLSGVRTNGVSLSTQGKSQEEIDAWFNNLFAGISDFQAGLFEGVQAMQRDGETTTATLQRLASSLTGVNAIFDTLGREALAVSVAGGGLASSLADLFGGLEAFNNTAAAYYQAFYTQSEQASTTARQLSDALASLGLSLPATRAEFRALVEAQDLTAESGRAAYAALLGLAPAFASIVPAAEEMARVFEQAGQSVAGEITRLRGLIDPGTTAQGYAGLQAQFATTTAAARAGSASALAALPGISQALEEAARLQAGTAAELALMRARLAASLASTMAGLGLQVPALATGTQYVPQDMLAMVHRGEAVVPAAYNPAAGGSAAGGTEMVAELRALRAEVVGLRSEVQADVMHNAKTARILDRVSPNGDSLLIMTQTELDAL